MELEIKNATTGVSETVGSVNPLPVSVLNQTSGYTLLQTQYVAISSAATYSIGDFITRIDEYNALVNPPTFLSSTWINSTKGTTLAGPPPAADITIASGSGLALDGTDAPAVTPPTGGVGIRGWLSGIYSRLAGVILAASSATVGNVGIIANSSAVSTANPMPVTVADITDSSPLPVSGTVSLGAGIAEVGKFTPMTNSSAVTASNPLPVTGTVSLASATSVVISSGSVALVAGAAAIGIVSVSSGSIALTAGAAAIGSVSLNQGGSAATSANPVPVVLSQIGTVSAVTVTGTLSTNMSYSAGTIALDGSDASGVSIPSGGVGIRGWLSGIYSRLAGVVLSSGTSIVGSVKLSDGTNTLLYKAETGRATIIQTPVIQSFHQKVHDSLGFGASAVNLGITASATTGSCMTVALVTGSAAGGELHLKPRDYINAMVLTSAISGTVAGTGAYVTTALYEAPSSVTLGSAGTIINRDRANALAPNATFYPLASARVGGVQIMTHLCSPNGSYSSGASWDADQEFILAPNTTYVLTVTNQNSVAVNGSFQMRFLWYEV